MGRWRYGVILDAGSSGTRLHVYKWLDNLEARRKGGGEELHSLPKLKTDKAWTRKIHPGISTFGDHAASVGPEHLEPLFKHALKHVPKHAVRDTPLFLLATAGVRLLPEAQRKALLSNVCSYARANTDFLVPDCDRHVQAISGETEGLYGWIAANYLLGGFDAPTDHDHGKGHHTYGFLDMGGASAQIAFAPNVTEAKKHAEDLRLLRLRLVDGQPTEYRVFVTTWLGFGVNEARRRYVEALLDASVTHDAKELPDPCLPVGLTVTRSGSVIDSAFSEAQDHRPYLIGTGRFDECLRQTYPLLDKDAPCEDRPCLLHGVHVPAIDFDINHFVGVSEYWHTTHEVFEMGHKDKAYDFNTYQKRVRDFCGQDWKAISDGVAGKKWGKKVNEQTAVEVCFKASWLINMLHDGIGIPRVGLEDTPTHGHNGTKEVLKHAKDKGFLDSFQAVDKIRDTEVSWTLGKMVLYASGQIPPRDGDLSVGFGSNVAGLPADFQYAGSTYLEKTNQSVSTGDAEVEGWQESLFPSHSPRRVSGLVLFLLIILLALFVWCGRDRRRGLYHWFRSTLGRPTAPKKRRVSGGGKFLFGGGSSVTYDRILDDGEAGHVFELADVDSENEYTDSSDAAGSNKVGRSSGWATPQLKVVVDHSGGSYFDGGAHGAGGGGGGGAAGAVHGLGLGSPGFLVGNPMDRSGLVVRTDSRDRLAGGAAAAAGGRISRTGSPVRLMKSPLMTPISDKAYD